VSPISATTAGSTPTAACSAPPTRSRASCCALPGTSFEIVANSQGADATIEVTHRSAPTVRPRTGPFTIGLSDASALRTDLSISRSWDDCLHVEAVDRLPLLTTHITAVAGDGSPATVTLDDPLPALAPDTLLGVLVGGAAVFPVLAQMSGSPVIDVQGAVQVDETLLLPRVGDRCTIWAGARYQAWLPGLDLRPHASERLGLTLVGVSTCDVDAVILPEPIPPRGVRQGVRARPGLEGPGLPDRPHQRAAPWRSGRRRGAAPVRAGR
jgi:hypothetical protein